MSHGKLIQHHGNTGNGSFSLSFNGSESGTALTMNPPFPVTYQVTETDASPGFVLATISVGTNPFGVAFNPGNEFMYVTNHGSNTVSVIDARTNTLRPPYLLEPLHLVLHLTKTTGSCTWQT